MSTLQFLDHDLVFVSTKPAAAHIPPAEAEETFYANLNSLDMVA